MRTRLIELAGLLLALFFLCVVVSGAGAVIWLALGDGMPPMAYWLVAAAATVLAIVFYAIATWPILDERDSYREELRRVRREG